MTDATDGHDGQNTARADSKATGIGIVLVVLMMGVGFFLGQWWNSGNAPPAVDVASSERYYVPVRGDEPQKGNADALVTIVEFADFQCPYCAKGAKDLEKAVAKFDDDEVRLVFKHYPLPFHAKAEPAARAAWAAQQQGKFWELHDYLYDKGGEVSGARAHLESLGGDGQAFTQAMMSDAAEDGVDADTREGGLIQLGSTPTYFVNGVAVQGAYPKAAWVATIRAALEHARQKLGSGDAAGLYDAYIEGGIGSDATAAVASASAAGSGKPVAGTRPANAESDSP